MSDNNNLNLDDYDDFHSFVPQRKQTYQLGQSSNERKTELLAFDEDPSGDNREEEKYREEKIQFKGNTFHQTGIKSSRDDDGHAYIKVDFSAKPDFSDL